MAEKISDFWDKVRERAYFKYEYKESIHLRNDSNKNWEEAFTEEVVEEKTAKEAYFNYKKGYTDPIRNWEHAKKDINERISFLAFYQHESDINKSSEENWVLAQKIYAENF